MAIFEGEKLYCLGAIEACLGRSRNTIYNWIHDGLLVNRVVAGKVVRVRVRLEARRVGQAYMVYGREIDAFLSALNRMAA